VEAAYGVAYDRVDLVIDRGTGEVVGKAGAIPATGHAAQPADPGVADLVGGYLARVRAVAERVVAEAARPLGARDGLGRLAAEGQRALAGTDLALVNAGSFRASLDAGPVTFAEVFAAQAYDHPVLRLRLTGQRVLALAGPGVFLAGARRAELNPAATYSVAMNELFADTAGAGSGPAAGTEVEALGG
jgi:2',3'-cyclic-nucleotide 2'-phosphodiesterase (5'-nucleotidase family)